MINVKENKKKWVEEMKKESKLILELKNIGKSYGKGENETPVLKDINLKFYENEFTAIIGPSGSVKTTLLNILGALDTPTSGSLCYYGDDISAFTPDQLADFRNRSLGFIFQFHHLLPEFSVKENVLIPAWIAHGNTLLPELEKRAEEIIDFMGMSSKLNSSTREISGGQQQRAAIARSLINSPKIVLADEPTGNLDSETTEQTYQLLRKINQEMGTTFIIVTHDMSIAEKCDRIISILDGKILEERYTNS
ncbi:MAG: ABC transporter ATP-binding protein [Fusobacteriaceae bacterium]